MAMDGTVMDRTGLKRGSGKGRYLYHQLADLIRRDIEAGVLGPREKLPSMDMLAREYDLNKATVRQAVAQLTEEGLVESVPARGTFVRDVADMEPRRGTLVVGWLSSIEDQGASGAYHVEMMNAARDKAQECGGHLVVMSTVGVEPGTFIRSVEQAGLDGAILLGPADQPPLSHFLDGALPVVLIDSKPVGQPVNCILSDNEGGGFLAVRHLLELGHRSLAFVSGPKQWRVSRERLAGAQAAVEQAGLAVRVDVLEGDFSPKSGAEAMRSLLDRKKPPTGLFFFNDDMAMSALQVVHERGALAVPRDVSLVGFDNVQWSAMTHPALTTVHVEKALMGRKAIERLHDILVHPKQTAMTITLPTRLVTRRSTGLLTEIQ
ncbi:MAG: GntR family transcriptional regulator [Spartobacteria bacterium]|nr:GntR family transcriptional regulator [Spartobacteria bacterium]